MSVIGVAALVAGGVGVSAGDGILPRYPRGIDCGAEGAGRGRRHDPGGLCACSWRRWRRWVRRSAWRWARLALAAGAGHRGRPDPAAEHLGVYPWPLLKAFVLGMLAAVMFATPALGRARATPPAALFRRISARRAWARRHGPSAASSAAAPALVLCCSPCSDHPEMVTLGLLIGAGVAYERADGGGARDQAARTRGVERGARLRAVGACQSRRTGLAGADRWRRRWALALR